MQLNKSNGEIEFNGLKIHSLTTIEALVELIEKDYAVKLALIYEDYNSYRITKLGNGKDSFRVTFFKNKIINMSIRLSENNYSDLEVTAEKGGKD